MSVYRTIGPLVTLPSDKAGNKFVSQVAYTKFDHQCQLLCFEDLLNVICSDVMLSVQALFRTSFFLCCKKAEEIYM